MLEIDPEDLQAHKPDAGLAGMGDAAKAAVHRSLHALQGRRVRQAITGPTASSIRTTTTSARPSRDARRTLCSDRARLQRSRR